MTRAEMLARIAERHRGRGELDPIREARRLDRDPDEIVDWLYEQGLPREERS